jgi:hypothetical protein
LLAIPRLWRKLLRPILDDLPGATTRPPVGKKSTASTTRKLCVARSFGQPADAGRDRVGSSKSTEKPFNISKGLVCAAFQKVKANKGAPGVDGQSVDAFEKDLKNNLHRIWNRMSSAATSRPR